MVGQDEVWGSLVQQIDILGQAQQRPEWVGELELLSQEMECLGCPLTLCPNISCLMVITENQKQAFLRCAQQKGKRQWARATADRQRTHLNEGGHGSSAQEGCGISSLGNTQIHTDKPMSNLVLYSICVVSSKGVRTISKRLFQLYNSLIVEFSLCKDLNGNKSLADVIKAFSGGIYIWMFLFAYTEILRS